MSDIFQGALERMVRRIDQTGLQLKGAFPHYADAKGDWTTTPDGDWTGGFWPGMCWLAAKATAGARYRRWALEWAERLRPRATSDTAFRGFLFYYSAVLGAVLFNDPAAREIALDGARHWARTYNPNAGCFPLGDAAEEAADVGARPGVGDPRLCAHAPVDGRARLSRRRAQVRRLVDRPRAPEPRGLLGFRRAGRPGHRARQLRHRHHRRGAPEARRRAEGCAEAQGDSRGRRGHRARAGRGLPGHARHPRPRLLFQAQQCRDAKRADLGVVLPLRGAVRPHGEARRGQDLTPGER